MSWKNLYVLMSMTMNLTAPMQPSIATKENQIAMAMLIICTRSFSLPFLGILPDFRKPKAGKTKSRGVNPIAPQMETKSPKNGMAAAVRVIKAI